MILWHEKVNKSNDVIKAVVNELYKEQVNIDGVVEIFNNGIEQGSVLKLFDKYNPKLDLCLWVYMPDDRKQNNEMNVIIGKHINCNKLNMWDGSNLEIKTFVDVNAREMHNQVRNFIIDTIIQNLNRTYDIPKI